MLTFEIILYFKIWKKIASGWAVVGRKPGQAEGSRLAFAAGYYLCPTQTIATPAPASSETHLKEKMLAFAATTTVHVRDKREREYKPRSLRKWKWQRGNNRQKTSILSQKTCTENKPTSNFWPRCNTIS
jgi:hypothetical protein